MCDCEVDDYCTSRSPWVRTGGILPGQITPVSGEMVPAPAKLPDVKTKQGL